MQTRAAHSLRLITVGDVAEMLGVGIGTVRDWCRQGRLRPIKISRSVRFDPVDILDLVERSKAAVCAHGQPGDQSPAHDRAGRS